ncbi:MAG TPA: PfkB family carbohydrate kinase [Mycobacteriales bacterium]|nr:PfkB family carbohydrate kinase [Mycobacteriales bacterium]
MSEMRVVALGVHVLDVLVRPVEEIPEGQGGAIVEEIRMTGAGTAGGTAITLAKLGAVVRSAGAIGTDPLGDALLGRLTAAGIDVSNLIRRDGVQTSASVLPIRPDGSRPAFHVIGANGTYVADDAPWDVIADATHLHLGGPEFMGGDEAARILSFARERGVVTSVDFLAPGDQLRDLVDWVAPIFTHVDYLLPNDEQVLGLTGTDSVDAGCAALVARGVGCVAATIGADGAVVATADGISHVPAFTVDVVDTTGCGDAFSAGFLRGISLGRAPSEAAVLGCAAAGLVAQGLGTDHGDFDLAIAEDLIANS